jgi:hypothetical protein
MTFLAAMLASAVAAAGTIDDGKPDAAYVEHGRRFSAHTAQMACRRPDGLWQRATGVAIAPRWVLTAAHVVDQTEAQRVNFDDGRERQIDLVVCHDEFVSGRFGWGDLALCRTDADLGLDWYPVIAEGQEVGQLAQIAGYGVTGRMSIGHSISDQRLRAGTNHVDRAERGLLVCRADRNGSPLEICIGPGDSGGPLWIGSGGGARLAGIHSMTMRDVGTGPLKSTYGEESCHTRLSLYLDWIANVIGGD